jgi:hypothetical protein
MEAVAYPSFMLGMTLGSTAFLSLAGLVLYGLGANEVVISLLLLMCLPSLLAPSLFFAYSRYKVVLIDSPRGLLWVIGSIITITAKHTFMAPIFVATLPMLFICALAGHKVAKLSDAKQWLRIGSVHMPAH